MARSDTGEDIVGNDRDKRVDVNTAQMILSHCPTPVQTALNSVTPGRRRRLGQFLPQHSSAFALFDVECVRGLHPPEDTCTNQYLRIGNTLLIPCRPSFSLSLSLSLSLRCGRFAVDTILVPTVTLQRRLVSTKSECPCFSGAAGD